MATIAETIVNEGLKGQTRIIKFVAVDCIGGDSTADFVCKGYDYAVIYAIENTDTAGAGTGRADFRAVEAVSSTAVAYRSAFATGTGAINAEEACLFTTATTLLGSRVDNLPDVARIVHDGSNTGTALTVDVYVELHRISR